MASRLYRKDLAIGLHGSGILVLQTIYLTCDSCKIGPLYSPPIIEHVYIYVRYIYQH